MDVKWSPTHIKMIINTNGYEVVDMVQIFSSNDGKIREMGDRGIVNCTENSI
jgi:hypothetical protein